MCEPISRLNEQLDVDQLRLPRRIHRPGYYHKRMALQQSTVADTRKPNIDILASLDVPGPSNLNPDPDSIMDNVNLGSRTAVMESEVPIEYPQDFEEDDRDKDS